MSNYTKENLIAIPPTAVPAGTLAMKVGNEIFTPGNIRISAGGMDFYKCASVDTTAKTWTGYLAVLTDGVYTFEETATTGLTYGTAFTPAENNIYNADATVYIKQLYMGKDPTLIFHAPLMSSMSAAETGQALTANGDVQYNFLAGRICAYFSSGDVSITSTIPEFPATGNPLTVMGWLYFDDVWNAANTLIRYNSDEITMVSYDGTIRVAYSGPYLSHGSIESTQWLHVALVSDGTNIRLYVDGAERASAEYSLSTTTSQTLQLGGSRSGAVSDIRIYNRCLTAEEIAAIAAE